MIYYKQNYQLSLNHHIISFDVFLILGLAMQDKWNG